MKKASDQLEDEYFIAKMMAMSIEEYMEKYPCNCEGLCVCDYEDRG